MHLAKVTRVLDIERTMTIANNSKVGNHWGRLSQHAQPVSPNGEFGERPKCVREQFLLIHQRFKTFLKGCFPFQHVGKREKQSVFHNSTLSLFLPLYWFLPSFLSSSPSDSPFISFDLFLLSFFPFTFFLPSAFSYPNFFFSRSYSPFLDLNHSHSYSSLYLSL